MKKSVLADNRWFRSLSLIGLVLLVAVACSKNNDATPAQVTSLEGNWKVSSLSAAGIGDLLPVVTQLYGTCVTDVTLSFKTGGSVSYDTPASCSTSATSLATISAATGIDANSTWSQSNNVVTIKSGTGATRSFTATSSSSSAVQLTGPATLAILTPGTPTTYTVTLGLRKQ